MGLEEAIKAIMDALGDSVSDFDEHFGVIRDSVSANAPQDSGEWEAKYRDLKEKYVSRFVSEFSAKDDREGDYSLDDATDGSPAVTLDDIDFNADSE